MRSRLFTVVGWGLRHRAAILRRVKGAEGDHDQDGDDPRGPGQSGDRGESKGPRRGGLSYLCGRGEPDGECARAEKRNRGTGRDGHADPSARTRSRRANRCGHEGKSGHRFSDHRERNLRVSCEDRRPSQARRSTANPRTSSRSRRMPSTSGRTCPPSTEAVEARPPWRLERLVQVSSTDRLHI
jgi:hypothetical protein